MDEELSNIIKLSKDDIKPASKMLARAFYNDLVNQYAYPDEKEKNARLPYAYEFVMRYGLRYGQVHTTSKQLEGIAVWLPSDKYVMPFWRLLLSGAIWPALKMGKETGQRMQHFSKYIKVKHKDLAPFNHWYLMLLGVDPRFQGRGFGSRLLREMLTNIDEEYLSCYLETHNEQNVPMYQHFGFKVIDEFIIPETTVKLWAMLRENADI
jgi:ribosomal protein S18 acetylase RimI-like enzyme